MRKDWKKETLDRALALHKRKLLDMAHTLMDIAGDHELLFYEQEFMLVDSVLRGNKDNLRVKIHALEVYRRHCIEQLNIHAKIATHDRSDRLIHWGVQCDRVHDLMYELFIERESNGLGERTFQNRFKRKIK